MVGGPYKVLDMRSLDRSIEVNVGQNRGLQPVLWRAFAQIAYAQDTVAADICRVVHAHTQGSEERMWGSDTNSLTESPFFDNVYDLVDAAAIRFSLAPSCFVEVEMLTLPSGAVTHEDPEDGYSAYGQMAFSVEYDATDDVARSLELEASDVTEDPVNLNTALIAAQPVSTIVHRSLHDVVDPDWRDDASELADRCERIDAEITMTLQGCPRILDLVFYERPWRHSQVDTGANPRSVHAFRVGGTLPSVPTGPGPQTDAADTSSDNEPRFGTHQMVDVANQQRLLGPLILSWHAYSPSEYDLGDTDAPHLALASSAGSSPIFATGESIHDVGLPGWIVEGVHAQDEEPTYPVGASYIPVRVRVCARVVSSGTATLRLNSSLTAWVEVTVTSTSFAMVEAWGWLECQVTGDQQDRGILQATYRSSVGFELRSIVVEYHRFD